MNIPAVEPQYVISLEEVFWGGALVAIKRNPKPAPSAPTPGPDGHK